MASEPNVFFQRRRPLLKGILAAGVSPFLNLAHAQSNEVLRFGVADPLTGPNAIFGLDQMQAVRWAVEDINAAGGVNGRKLEAIIVDHQANPQVGISVVERLISVDKVPLVITAFSNVVRAVAPIANREKVLLLSVGANSPDIKNLGDYVQTTFPLADVDMRALGKYLYGKLGKRRAAVLFVNNETGIEGAKVLRQSFLDSGGQVVAYESYEAERADYTGLVLKVRASNPDVIHIHSVIRDFTAIVAQLRQLGSNTQVTSFQTSFNPQMIKELGKSAEGIIVTALARSVEDNKNLPAFLERWTKAYNREPNGLPYTQFFYDSVYILAALYKYCLNNKIPLTGENLRKALVTIKTLELPLTNRVTFKDDRSVESPTYFWQVKDGRFQVIGKQE